MGQFGRVFRRKKPHRCHIGNARMMARGSYRSLPPDLRPLLKLSPAPIKDKADSVRDKPEQNKLRRTNNPVGFVDI